jgi:hypothetical protein
LRSEEEGAQDGPISQYPSMGLDFYSSIHTLRLQTAAGSNIFPLEKGNAFGSFFFYYIKKPTYILSAVDYHNHAL